ncbi:MAG: tetratricopeptide repeat protein [Gemmatimonadetes bacterium]|nr:tetratricopeptide repeat protein [Gemmatimonadota bacterium]
MANEFRKAGDLDRAIELCEAHLGEQAGNMNGHVVYGQALFDSGRYDDAQKTFETALGLDPENLIALRHLGDTARLNGHGEAAIGWYTRVLEEDPRNDEILAFIDEVKASGAGAAEPPAESPADPLAPMVIEQSGVPASDARTVEISPPPRSSESNTTPFAPLETVPIKRPSIPLIDVDIDFSGDFDAPAASVEPVAAPEAPTGDIELSDMTFSDAEPIGLAGAPSAPSAPSDATAEPSVPSDDIEIESALGWDMGGEAEPATEPAATPDATPDAGPDPVLDPPPVEVAPTEVFVTETMAELYVQQGLHDDALNVYRQLAEMHPGDESFREKISALESEGHSSQVPAAGDDAAAEEFAVPEMDIAELAPAEPAPAGAVTARGFFAALAQRRPLRPDGTAPAGIPVVEPAPASRPARSSGSVDALFGGPADTGEDAIAEALATSVGVVEAAAAIRGRPTEQAGSDLSLDSVFRGDSAERASGSAGRTSAMLKFDQFFSTDKQTDKQTDQPSAPPATDSHPRAPADDAKFQSWLERLQGKDE